MNDVGVLEQLEEALPSELTANRFKPYPAYKESGVEWIGQVPVHWPVAPLYARYHVQLGKMLDTAKLTGANSAPYLRNVDVQWGCIRTDDLPLMDFGAFDKQKFALRKHDILVCEGGEVGRAAIWDDQLYECYYQKALHRVRPMGEKDIPRYFFYVMYAASKIGVFVAQGNPNTIDHLTAEKFRRHRFPFPLPDEQSAISDFLDDETAKIDALIAKKRRLIELLKEKRTALITHVVTKGIDPSAPMKPSGIDWIGDIPAHWTILPLRRFVKSMCDGPFGSNMKSEHYAEEGIRLIRLQNIGSGAFRDEDRAYIDEAHFLSLNGHDVRPGDLLIAGLGDEGHPVGRACIFPDIAPTAMVKADCFRVRLDQQLLRHDFAAAALSSQALQPEIALRVRGATRSRINLSNVASLRMPIPPEQEQRRMLDYVANFDATAGTIVEKLNRHIFLLLEYRAAVITATVTGKIDVRAAASVPSTAGAAT